MAQGLKELKVNARDLELWKTPQTLAVGGREGGHTKCSDKMQGISAFLFCFVFLVSPRPNHMGFVCWQQRGPSRDTDSEEVAPASCLRHCAVKRAV